MLQVFGGQKGLGGGLGGLDLESDFESASLPPLELPSFRLDIQLGAGCLPSSVSAVWWSTS